MICIPKPINLFIVKPYLHGILVKTNALLNESNKVDTLN